MSLWFLLWLVLSVTLLYFFGWTLYILFNQKKVWKLFAQKKHLRYVEGGFAESPQMEGLIDGYNASFFPAQYDLGDVRHSRKMTAIEITLKTEMPFDGFVCSGELVNIAKTALLPHEIKIDDPAWKNEFAVLTNSVGSMQAYLTPERTKIVMDWLKKENLWFLLGFRFGVFILRIDTPLPLDNIKKLNALTKKILADVQALEVPDAEKAMIKMAGARAGNQPNLTVNTGVQTSPLELELDDETSPSPNEKPKEGVKEDVKEDVPHSDRDAEENDNQGKDGL